MFEFVGDRSGRVGGDSRNQHQGEVFNANAADAAAIDRRVTSRSSPSHHHHRGPEIPSSEDKESIIIFDTRRSETSALDQKSYRIEEASADSSEQDCKDL